jgi:hypothetical protein
MDARQLLAALQDMDPENLSAQLWFEVGQGAFQVRSLKSADTDGIVLSHEHPQVVGLQPLGTTLSLDDAVYVCDCGNQYFTPLRGNAFRCNNCDACVQGA